MQIKIDLKILIFLLIFHFTNQIKTYILLMIFACIHELGHLLIGLILGFKPTSIEIKPIGFSVIFLNSIEDYNNKVLKGNVLEVKKILVYLAGPLINIFLAIIIYFINIKGTIGLQLIYINFLIAFFNLLPIYPLDGGRIVKSVTCLFYGLLSSYKITDKISWIVTIMVFAASSILVLKVHNYGLVLIIGYLLYVRICNSRLIQWRIRLLETIQKKNRQ